MDIMKTSLIALAIACQLCSGIAYMNSGDYDSALNQFGTIIVNSPDSQFCDDAMYYSVLCYLAKNDKESAKATYQKLIDKFPNSEYRQMADQIMNEASGATSEKSLEK